MTNLTLEKPRLQKEYRIVSEVIKGSTEVGDLSEFNTIPPERISYIAKEALKRHHISQTEVDANGWRGAYHRKPPAPEEFMSPKWLGPHLYEAVFDTWKYHWPRLWSGDRIYNELILYGSIGRGKSFFSSLTSVYSLLRLWCLKDAYFFYGNAPINPYCYFLASFTETKTKQIVLKPILEVLEASPMFQRVKYEDHLISKQHYEYGAPVVWTTASIMGNISLSRNLHYIIGTNVGQQLGLTLFGGMMSEVNYFVEKMGVSFEDVFKFYKALKRRIFTRFSKVYGSFLTLDSSANDMENPLEKYIREEAPNDPNVYMSTETHYDARPELYPEWDKTGKIFQVFPGAEGRQPFIINKENKRDMGDNDTVLEVPIDVFKDFDTDIYQALKDICGIPSGSKRKLFPNKKFIADVFNCNIHSVPMLTAPVSEEPKGLLFNKLIELDKFFYKDLASKYRLKRAPKAIRAIHFDLATAEDGDSAGVSMEHLEMLSDGTITGISDFHFPVLGGGEQINLSAFENLVYDLMFEGKVPIKYVSADGYQSTQLLQNIQRRFYDRIRRKVSVNTKKRKKTLIKGDMSVKTISVDKEKHQYNLLKTYLLRGKYKAGYSDFLKNNLLSLEDNPKKIDHSDGPSRDAEGNYTGKNAKDVSDALAGAHYHLLEFQSTATYLFEDCEKRNLIKKLKKFKKLKLLTPEDTKAEFKKQQFAMAKKRAIEIVEGKYTDKTRRK